MVTKSGMILAELKQVIEYEGGGFRQFFIDDDNGGFIDFRVTTGLNSFVTYKKDSREPLLLRARELELGDKFWLDVRLLEE